MRWWLLPASWLYAGAVAVIGRRRGRAPVRLPVPVISVGNITAGGTGKTEAVLTLARGLLAMGVKPGILTRGWLRLSQAAQVIVSRGAGPEVDVREAGDEPFLMARRLPGAAVVVGANRIASGLTAVKDLGCRILILDDGFQRRRQIYRDLDLVCVDAADPKGGGGLLPAGNLREPWRSLAEAGGILVTRADAYPTEPVLERLRRAAPRVPVMLARHKPIYLSALGEELVLPPEDLRGRRILAVCGIGRPEAFLRTLAALGADIAGQAIFPDHHWYTASDRAGLLRQAGAARAEVVTTAKDAVRLGWNAAQGVPAWSLDVELEILSGGQRVHAWLKHLADEGCRSDGGAAA